MQKRQPDDKFNGLFGIRHLKNSVLIFKKIKVKSNKVCTQNTVRHVFMKPSE